MPVINQNVVLATLKQMRFASLTGGPTAPAAPIMNLKEWKASKPVRFINPAERYVDIDHGAPYAPRLVAPMYVSDIEGLQWRYTSDDDAGNLGDGATYVMPWQSIPSDEPAFIHRAGRKHDWCWNPAIPAHRFGRVEFNDAVDLQSDRLDVSNIIVSKGFQPKFNMSLGAVPPGMIDPSMQVDAVGGQSDSVERRSHDITEFTLNNLSRDEALGDYRQLVEEVGVRVAFATILHPHASTYRQGEAIWGRMREIRQPRRVDYEFSVSISIKEDLP